MHATGLISAGIAFGIALGTALVTAWSTPGVVSFGDVTPATYGVAIMGSLVGALTGYQARMKDAPLQPGEIA